jgi:Protein of unknown function (DUF992)
MRFDAACFNRINNAFGRHLGETSMLKHYSALAALALMAMLAVPADAQTPPSWTQAGMLTCRLNPSIGFIIAGHQSMECRFNPNGPYPPQAYEGALNTVGLDIGFTAGGVMGWAVFAPTIGVPAGALAGEYVGVSGDIGIGAGVGANILMGGSGRTIALQPVSLEGSVAVNIALGVSGLKLRPAF